MNRVLLCLALIVALLGVQGMSLHAHLDENAGDAHAATSHQDFHVHSHVMDLDDHQQHADAVSVDLLTSTLSRDQASTSITFTLQALLILVWVVAWVCRRRLSPFVPIVYFSPPRQQKPSPRAPPL